MQSAWFKSHVQSLCRPSDPRYTARLDAIDKAIDLQRADGTVQQVNSSASEQFSK
jgi:hypothetical protein